MVEAKLEEKWSPQQISAVLSITYPDNWQIHVSHERVYISLFVQGRGGLRRDLHNPLRTGRARRRRKDPYPYEGQEHISEMAVHCQFTVDSGIQIYFCDPRSPWQRGSNENTNGLLRQYLPKGTDLSIHTEAELDAIAEELNNRPRQTLGWMTPLERFAQVLQ
ncbi:MAG: IS30 family transposase [Actinobacteria bacterium]|nr:IS30 family transposase [Actinomycetota bacterium]